MKRMPVDRPSGTSSGRLRGALGRVGRWTVVTIVLGFALIGFLHVTRGTAVRHVRGVSSDGVPIGVSEFPLMAMMATGASLQSGNVVEVCLNGDQTLRAEWPTRSGRS